MCIRDRCITCSAGSYLLNGVCTACPDPLMQATAGTCACSSAYTQVNDRCLHSETYASILLSYPVSTAYTVTYPDVVSAAGTTTSSVTSAVFEQWFYEAGVKCQRGLAPEWCQMLANMCVLQMYLKTASSCALFISLTSTTEVHGFTGWTTGVGFLYYAVTTHLADTTSITTQYSYQKVGVPYTDTISMRFARFAFNGTFLGWQNLTTQLALCGGDFDAQMKWTSFGTWKRIACNIDINRFINGNDTEFMDPYFVNEDGTLYPMPVIVANYVAGGAKPQDKFSEFYYQETFGATAALTRRFFLYDNLSGRTGVYNATPSVVRIIKTAGILISTQDLLPSDLHPPRLVIQYHEVDITNLAKDTKYEVATEFGIAYDMWTSDGSFADGYSFWFPIVLVLGLMVLGLRGYRHARANLITDITCRVGCSFFAIFCKTVHHIFGPGYIGLCFYWYVVFKWSNEVVTLVPDDAIIADDMILYWVISFMGVLGGTISTLGAQTMVDLFLIDWECARGRVYGANKTLENASISTWRTLFVANEFARIQTDRLIDFDLTCMLVLFFLAGVPSFEEPYYNASCNTPDGDLLVDCGTWARSTLLRFSVDAFFWILAAAVQVPHLVISE
eukprot:TRINITY_DN1067_c0_g2_i4.p1 TRINITY_DN1067_c0_g2~~TRINITY_DN1067_c0_g2_i4.p1  ORF type:complete len:632 (+),score=90.68 TRINITY_DN1067_c0_g2_i4:47-1897(+)